MTVRTSVARHSRECWRDWRRVHVQYPAGVLGPARLRVVEAITKTAEYNYPAQSVRSSRARCGFATLTGRAASWEFAFWFHPQDNRLSFSSRAFSLRADRHLR